MNRFEFIATGHMLFGNTWKTDLADALHFSAKSGNVAKIATGKRNVTADVKSDLVAILQRKAKNMANAVEYLRNPEKLIVNTSEFCILTFDEYGVRQWDAFQGCETSDFTVVLNHAELFKSDREIEFISKSDREIEFISLIVSAAAQEAYKTGNNAELIKIIPEYFDLQFLNIDLNDNYIEYEKNEGDE